MHVFRFSRVSAARVSLSCSALRASWLQRDGYRPERQVWTFCPEVWASASIPATGRRKLAIATPAMSTLIGSPPDTAKHSNAALLDLVVLSEIVASAQYLN